MKPILFDIGNIHIYSYGTMIALGIISAYFILNSNAKKKGFDEDSILNMTIITVIIGVLGGKLFYIFTEFKSFLEDPMSVLENFGNGFVVYGAIILGMMSVYIYCRRKKWDVLQILDMVVPAVAFAQGLGRIGCVLAGCCYGHETTSKLCLVFPEGSLAPAGVHLIPTQIYSAVFDILLAIFLIIYLRKSKKNGNTFGLYMLLYSVGRFIIEFFRGDPRGSVSILSTSQFIAIFTAVLAIGVLTYVNIKGRKIESEKI